MHISRTVPLFIAGVILSGAFSVVFAWTGPTATAPNGNVAAPINTGSASQIKNGTLGVDSLVVFGTIKIGNDSTACQSATEGSMRYVPGTKQVEFCDGSSWRSLTAAAATFSNCSFNGTTIAHGSAVTAYQTQNPAVGVACVSQNRSCSNGVLSGSYPYGSCSFTAESGMRVFSSSGAWTVPTGVTRARVTAIGAAGGSHCNAFDGSFGIFGGNGGAGVSYAYNLTPGSTIPVTVGTEGGGICGFGYGDTGGSSSFGDAVTATGGSGAYFVGSCPWCSYGSGSDGGFSSVSGDGYSQPSLRSTHNKGIPSGNAAGNGLVIVEY